MEGYYPPLVPSHLWMLKDKIRENKKRIGKMDTPFLLRNIVHCKTCLVELKPKDTSPSGYKGRYLNYSCSICKGRIDAYELHEDVIYNLKENLSPLLIKAESLTQKRLKKYRNSLRIEQEEIRQKQERNLYNERQFSQSNSEVWKQVLFYAKKEIEKKSVEVNSALEEVDFLLRGDSILQTISHFRYVQPDFLNPTEMRTLCLAFINKVNISFPLQSKIEVEYRVFPFLNIG